MKATRALEVPVGETDLRSGHACTLAWRALMVDRAVATQPTIGVRVSQNHCEAGAT